MNLQDHRLLDATLTELASTLINQNQSLCTAESCTGGWIAACCTSLAGSSQWFERGFVTYSNEAKQKCIGVPSQLITQHGAVSQEVAQAMAQGALLNSNAHWSVSVTGIAGPTGGSAEKPVGLVWFGFAFRPDVNKKQGFSTYTVHMQFPGNRQAVRFAAVQFALEEILWKIKATSLL